MRCGPCRGLGWVLARSELAGAELVGSWPLVCPRCGGKGRDVGIPTLARAIEENPTTLYRLAACRPMRLVTAARLLSKLSAFLGPP